LFKTTQEDGLAPCSAITFDFVNWLTHIKRFAVFQMRFFQPVNGCQTSIPCATSHILQLGFRSRIAWPITERLTWLSITRSVFIPFSMLFKVNMALFLPNPLKQKNGRYFGFTSADWSFKQYKLMSQLFFLHNLYSEYAKVWFMLWMPPAALNVSSVRNSILFDITSPLEAAVNP